MIILRQNYYSALNKYLDSVGEIGSMERLTAISKLDLGKRSEAAKRVIEKRKNRMKS